MSPIKPAIKEAFFGAGNCIHRLDISNPSAIRQEASFCIIGYGPVKDIYIQGNYAYITESDIALRKLEMVWAERAYREMDGYTEWYLDMSSPRDDTTKQSKSPEEIGWEEYSSFVLDERLSTEEGEAMLAVKRFDLLKFKRLEYDEEVVFLNEKLDKLRQGIDSLESRYPKFWYRMHVQKQ